MKLSTPAMLVTFLCALVTAPAVLAAPNVDGLNGIDGACCLPDGDCVVVSPTDCAGMTGEYRGDGTACDPDTCPTGACCLQGGACVTLTGPACALVANSTYQGDGTACAGGQCPTGACCLPDTTCVATSPADCTAQGGEYQGNGVLCATFGVCDGPTGACCLPNGNCADDVTMADCLAQFGVYQDDGSRCDDAGVDCVAFGACCLPDGNCADDVTMADCLAQFGMYQDDGSRCDGVNCVAFGACCLPNGTCADDLAMADCLAQFGMYQDDGSRCDDAGVDCVAFGACCLPDGNCADDVTMADCTAQSGVYQEDGSRCDDAGVDCVAFGACCLPNGNCMDDVTMADCTAQFGMYQDDGSRCDGVNCVAFGACCLPNGNCADDITMADCEAQFGMYQDDGSRCDDAGVDCVAFGACCLPNGNCMDDVTMADCEAQFGMYQDDGSRCDDAGVNCVAFGACCLPNGNCADDITMADCEAQFGMYQDDGSRCDGVNCVAFGACCLPNGNCADDVTMADCEAQFGMYQDDGSRCDDAGVNCVAFGACCLPDGTCVADLTQADCEDAPRLGTYRGDGVMCADIEPCPQPGACCVAGDLCTEVIETECDTMGGGFQGEMVPCSPTICPRACCLENGLCENLDSAACATVGGTDLGEGADCATRPCIAACCLGDGTCQDLDRTACSMTGGTYAGFGNDCAAAPCNGACCLDDATCQDIDGDACAAAGGMFRGLGSTCISLPCLGGCCLDTGCADPEISEGACYNAGGIFSGRGVACEFTACSGRCCVTTDTENLLCVDVMSRGECRMLGGVFEVGSCGGTGTPCDTRSEDFCDDAFEIVVGETAFANFHAEAEPDGPPTCGDSPIGADIWFDFCPEGPGLYEFSTCGSSFDTVIEVYTGADCPDYVRVACNDDFDCNNDGLPDTTSSVTVQVEDNIDYHVRIGGYLGARGSGVLTIKIVGDDCEDAVDASVMQGNEIELEFPTRGFTLDGPGACVGDRGGAGVITDTWYEYDSGDFVGTTEITATADPSVETYIAVYTDLTCPVGSATRIACEGPGTPVLLPVVANERFKIQLLLNRPADEGGGAGSGTLKIVEQVESTGNECDPCLDVFERPCGDIAENTGTVDDTGPECQVGTITEDVVDAWRCFSVGPTAFGGEILVQNNALFPHTLAVFDGCPELTGELLDCEMSIAETTFVRVAIPVEGVVDYRIRLGAAAGDSGPYELSIACPFDVTSDGVVDFADILNVLSNWMAPVGPEHGDGNGVVDFADILGILTGWQFVCPTGDVLPTGACCLGTGGCEIMTAGDCECRSGTYQGDDSDCGSCGQ